MTTKMVECNGCLVEELEDECKIGFWLSVEPEWYCHDCQITLKELYGEELDMTENSVKPTTTSALPPKPATTTALPPTKPPCKHHLTPFTFGDYTVYLTGSNHTDSAQQAAWPDAGVYLSSGWFSGLAATTDGVGIDVAQWPSAFVSWPDGGVIDTDVLMPMLKWAADKVTVGDALEIACVGGHGRTGTFAAALMIYLGWDAQEAFDHLRSKYCGKAVETRVQAELLLKVRKLCLTQ